jgi:adenosylcobinamide kinase/adenosylcobinamide-phosphate guanylyltransferase
VVCPPAAVERFAPWIGPEDPVTLTPVLAGDRLLRAGYVIRALAATHDGPEVGPAVIYDIRGPDGARLLYATDTGPLSAATHRELVDAEFDIALVERTFGAQPDHGTDHLDHHTFTETITQLRASRALTTATQVVAVHLSHHNPSPPDLRAQLAPVGVRVLSDGDCVRSGVPMTPPVLPRRTLVLGGARSGKSSYAERLIDGWSDVTYVATAPGNLDDQEWQARIAAHQARRPSHWRTLESCDLASVLDKAEPGSIVVIDCLTLWLAETLDRSKAWTVGTAQAEQELAELVHAWTRTSAHVVAVTNEVGSGVVPHTPSGRLFRDLQGKMNAQLAAKSDAVTLVVAGRPIQLAAPDTAVPANTRSPVCRST